MSEGEHEWATNHLPRLYHAEDIVSKVDSTLETVVSLFNNAKFAGGKHNVYK